MTSEHSGWPSWAKVLLAIWVVAAGLVLGVYLHSILTEDDTVIAKNATGKSHRGRRLPPEITKTNGQGPHKLKPASAGSNGTTPVPSEVLSAGAQSAFAGLENQLSAQIGVSVAPFGSSPPEQIGQLTSGHAWSSFKVPVLVTLMRAQGSLSAEEEGWAAAALTASDNGAAASLFQHLEFATHGDLATASGAIEGVLREAGDSSTVVATAPPPPGAISTWGQTEWSLSGSVAFYRSLACGQLLPPEQTEYVLALMEQVISEQQWGLGQASFPAGTRVAFKAGWGPDGSETGPYLVRQSGILRSGSGGVVVTIAAQDDSGTFEAGVADIDQVADWVSENVTAGAGSGC
jgi:hypothetical protein